MEKENYFVRLLGLSAFLEQQVNLETSLDELVRMAGDILHVDNCSIMLFKDEDNSGDFRLRLFAKCGQLPPHAFQEATKINHGIAGHVAATGEALLVDDIRTSPLLPLARRPHDPHLGFICVPIVINSKVIGVLNLSNPRDDRRLDQNDLNLATFVALLVGKSVQVIQLQNMLRSKYAQIVVAAESRNAVDNVVAQVCHEPEKMTKILAKSFYTELTRAGLGKEHIISAATEILSLLNESLVRHRTRIDRS